jgi:hypothetical protein
LALSQGIPGDKTWPSLEEYQEIKLDPRFNNLSATRSIRGDKLGGGVKKRLRGMNHNQLP